MGKIVKCFSWFMILGVILYLVAFMMDVVFVASVADKNAETLVSDSDAFEVTGYKEVDGWFILTKTDGTEYRTDAMEFSVVSGDKVWFSNGTLLEIAGVDYYMAMLISSNCIIVIASLLLSIVVAYGVWRTKKISDKEYKFAKRSFIFVGMLILLVLLFGMVFFCSYWQMAMCTIAMLFICFAGVYMINHN